MTDGEVRVNKGVLPVLSLSRRRLFATVPLLLSLSAVSVSAFAQKTGDDIRPIPPPGIAVPDADRTELTAGLAALSKEIDSLKSDLKGKPQLLRYLPDVQIFEKAVRYPLTYNEFFNPKELATAKALLQQGMERAQALRTGTTPWITQTGLLVLGYVSKIDGSVQPYGLVVPTTWTAGDKQKRRLDFFCHGRGETLSELAFINDRQHNTGDFSPPDTFVLHPYGRFCNANRFAGEVDLFEALADAQSRYPIDPNRLVVRGFSMGGASCWQYATHHTDIWVAAAPGAGFSETMEFLRIPEDGAGALPWYETKLLHWYDPIDYAANLTQLPTVAYNGDKDGQKQAADRMQDAMAKEGLTLTRVVGPNTGHWYNPDSKKDIDARLAEFVTAGRNTVPKHIRFTTWTLRYNRMHYITVTGLKKHWERARVNADLDGSTLTLTTENVTHLTLAPSVARKTIVLDGQTFPGMESSGLSGEGLSPIAFMRTATGWSIGAGSRRERRKKPGLQGPVDDAFMDRFVMVRPTGKAASPQVDAWVSAELPRALSAWRVQLRGDAPVKDDKDISKADISGANLVLWGDPSSNSVLARIAKDLPVKWDKDGTIHANGKTYPAGTSVPILIYPNPLNPEHYVVLNSGITWREEAYLNNARQRARLPDWAIIDITTPPDKFAPGRIADAGFFDESWKWQPAP